ncbi:hypothetical protein K1718_09020 [Roseibium porphyridii]|uniref:Uncharacterized protein n=1 Tax=Roseibium porphyridii TaxID=2866279 RepID=A0ABY8F7K7_9HYPH|nr:hypothetical protein [Roseibium sp. KMA01]WFE91483.1 hypothetical protein K1718_09020 [Roseibium sp. KMA01]
MFRILLIVGLLLAGAQQSLARGNVDLYQAAPEAIAVYVVDEADLLDDECCEDKAVTDTKPTYCKSSDCKAVIGSGLLETFETRERLDTTRPLRRSSVSGRLEPRPPNT